MSSEGGEQPPCEGLEDRLGHRFADPALLEEALTHASILGIRGAQQICNERLEFLGDRVLALVIAELLHRQFPADSEGALARRHSALVRREALAEIGAALGLASHIRMSGGEFDQVGCRSANVIADACEAVIGAVYLDGGLEAAKRLIGRYWQPLIKAAACPPTDAKTELQEWAQGRALPLPHYRVIGSEGPPHEPLFSVSVTIEGLDPVSATGPSKRAAEQAAAKTLLNRIGIGNDASR